MCITHLRKFMIISRTPLRVSFCGGGTDIDDFSKSSNNGGKVISMAIDRYVYVTINPRFDNRIRVSYSSLEIVDSVDEIRHDLVRESMKLTGVESGIEITTIADIPGKGTGLGSSSTVTVGLLNALHHFNGRSVDKDQLADEACKIEIELLNQPIGRQDQYAAAFGGLNAINFSKEGVNVNPLIIPTEIVSQIENEFSLVYTGITRKASSVLSEKPIDYEEKVNRLNEIREQAEIAEKLLKIGDISKLGLLLNEAWINKRAISNSVSNDKIDSLYHKILDIGANGAKLVGAGGGGFFLVHGTPGLRNTLEKNLDEKYRIIPIKIDNTGSSIIHG